MKTPLYSRICAHRPALLQPSNFNRMAKAMLVPTAGQIALSTNWPNCIATPVSFGAAAYPLASTFCDCAPFNVQCAIFRFSTAPAVGTKRRKQCAPRTPPLIKIRAVWLGEFVLHRFVKSQPKHYPGDPMGPAGPLACLSPPSFFTRRKMVPPEGPEVRLQNSA